jgi:hypothetical protein
MKLADLRRAAIKTGVRIHFPLSDGLECVVNEHGIAEVPSLKAIPAFNLEEELAKAPQFTLETVGIGDKAKVRPQILNREQLAAIVVSKTAEAAHDDHDE